MKTFPKNFLIGTATSAHQVEGDNKNNDVWVMEQAKNSMFVEPSLQAVEHYVRFREDIDLMAVDNSDIHIQVGMNSEAVRYIEENQKGMAEAFQMDAKDIAPFLGPRSEAEDRIVMMAHCAARRAIKSFFPKIKVGLTFSFTDYQPEPGAVGVDRKTMKRFPRRSLRYLGNIAKEKRV